jgi:hypothetical protein
MTRGGRVSWVAVAVVAGVLLSARAEAGGKGKGKGDETRESLDKATAAFALNHFAEAAELYEKAFALKPDPAVLYNAAQAHRLAGNKPRALELYQSYLRLYGTDKRAEVERHIENLKQAIEHDHAVATSPPTTPAPVGGAHAAPPPEPPAPSPPAKVEPAPAPVAAAAPPVAPPPAPKAAEPAPVLVTQAAPPAERGSVVTKPWFWVVVGGVVVAGVAGVFLLRKSPSDPTASLGATAGN